MKDEKTKHQSIIIKMARRQIYVVLNGRNVWKHLFFMKKDQCLPAVKKFYGEHLNWESAGKDTIKCGQVNTGASKTFRVLPLQEFTSIKDVPYSKVTQHLKGEKHK